MEPISTGLIMALSAIGGAVVNKLENDNQRSIQEKEDTRIKNSNQWGKAHSFGGNIGTQKQELGPYTGPSDLGALAGGGLAGLQGGMGLVDALSLGGGSSGIDTTAPTAPQYNLGVAPIGVNKDLYEFYNKMKSGK